MKILSAAQIKDADLATIKSQEISSFQLMKRASKTFVDYLLIHLVPQISERKIYIFCGLGNNGGDGLCIANYLSVEQKNVEVFILEYSNQRSPDFEKALAFASSNSNLKITNVLPSDSFPNLRQDSILIDSIFGSGLNRPLENWIAKFVEDLNSKRAFKISVDIPSGFFADKSTNSVCFNADLVLTFELPKLAFLLPDSEIAVKRWDLLPINLDSEFIVKQNSHFYYFTKENAIQLLEERLRFAHKGKGGHILLFAGSYGKIGAAILAAKSGLKAGAGLLTVHSPKCAYQILQIACPEAMCSVDFNEDHISNIPLNLSDFWASLYSETNDVHKAPYSTIAIGPGIGQHNDTKSVLLNILENSSVPLVLDADALNLIASENYLDKVPENSILSPHVKEFERLAGGKLKNSFDRVVKARELAKKHKVIIILKGAHSAVILPDGNVYFNSTGNPYMATAGSGDVLTGIIAAFLAQSYSPADSAKLAVFFHGLAGDKAMSLSFPFVASQIIANFSFQI